MKKRLSNIFTRTVLAALCCLPVCIANAQDIHFSQFFEAPLLRNPSLAGIFEGDVRFQLVYKDQWKKITPSSFRSVSMNGEYKMPIGKGDDFLTVGAQILHDRAGTAGLAVTHLLPVINYHKSLSSQYPVYLSLGFMGGYVQKKIDYFKLTTGNQYGEGGFNPDLPTGEYFKEPVLRYWDGSTGLSFNTAFGETLQHHLFAGVAYHHINRGRATFYNTPIKVHPKYVYSAGVKLANGEFSTITLQADVFKQGPAQEIIGGGWYSHSLGGFSEDPEYRIHGGLFYRVKDAIIPMIKIDKRAFSMTFSYDINISQLKVASQMRGGFELGLAYRGFIERNSSQDKVLCPFF